MKRVLRFVKTTAIGGLLLIPGDHLFWTEGMASAIESITDFLETKGAEGLEMVTTARASDRFQNEASRLGWKVETQQGL